MSSDTIKIKRGDKIRFNRTIKRDGAVLPAAQISKIRMTVKVNVNDADPGVAQIGIGTGISLVDDTSGTWQFFVSPAVTTTWPIGVLAWDIQIEPIDGDVETPVLGSIVVAPDVTRTTG